jgi:hypothetical protein
MAFAGDFNENFQYLSNDKGEKSHVVVPIDFFTKLIRNFNGAIFNKENLDWNNLSLNSLMSDIDEEADLYFEASNKFLFKD